MAEQSPWQVIWAPTKPEQRQGQVLAGPTRPQRLPTSTATRGDARRTTDRMLREAGRPRSPADEFLASLEEQRLAAMGGGGGGNRNAMFDTRRQMLEDLYAQQLQSVQGMYDQGMGQIGTSLDGTLGSLGNIRDQYMAQAAQMQQDQAAMLAGALGRVAQEQAMLNADLAAQGGRTVDPAAFDARGVLEAQGANQASLQSRLAELQAGAFADREGGAQSIAQGGRDRLEAQRLSLQDAIIRERIQALAENEMSRLGAMSGGGGRGSGGGPLPEGYFVDDALGLPRGTYAASPAQMQNQMMQSYQAGPAPSAESQARDFVAGINEGLIPIDEGVAPGMAAFNAWGDLEAARLVQRIYDQTRPSNSGSSGGGFLQRGWQGFTDAIRDRRLFG